MTKTTPTTDRSVRVVPSLSVVAICAGLMLGACSSDGSGASNASLPAGVTAPAGTIAGDVGAIGDGERDPAIEDGGPDVGSETPPEADAVEPEQPVVGDGGAETSSSGGSGGVLVVAEADDGGLTTEEWAVIIILGVLVVGVIIGLVSWISGRSRRRRQQDAGRSRQQSEVIGGARWAHDQATTSVLAATDPAALRSTWAAVQPRLFDLETSIATSHMGDADLDAAIAQLGRSVGDLQSALAADVALRLSGQAQQTELVASSRRTVLQRNDELERALGPLLYAQA